MPKPAIFIPRFPASELHDKNTNEKLFPPALGKIKEALQKLVQIPGDVVAGPPILDTRCRSASGRRCRRPHSTGRSGSTSTWRVARSSSRCRTTFDAPSSPCLGTAGSR